MQAFPGPIGASLASPSSLILVTRLPNDLSRPAGDHPAVVCNPYHAGEYHAEADDHRNGRAVEVRGRSAGLSQLHYKYEIASVEDDQAEIGRALVDQPCSHTLTPAGVVASGRRRPISRLS